MPSGTHPPDPIIHPQELRPALQAAAVWPLWYQLGTGMENPAVLLRREHRSTRALKAQDHSQADNWAKQHDSSLSGTPQIKEQCKRECNSSSKKYLKKIPRPGSAFVFSPSVIHDCQAPPVSPGKNNLCKNGTFLLFPHRLSVY